MLTPSVLAIYSEATFSEVAAHSQTLRRNRIDMFAAENELGRSYITIGSHQEYSTDRALNCSCQMQK